MSGGYKYIQEGKQQQGPHKKYGHADNMYHIIPDQGTVLINQHRGFRGLIIDAGHQVFRPVASQVFIRRYIVPAQQLPAKIHIHPCIPVKKLSLIINQAYMQIFIRCPQFFPYLVHILLYLKVAHVLPLNLLNHGKDLDIPVQPPWIPMQAHNSIGIRIFHSLSIPGKFLIVYPLTDILIIPYGFTIVIAEYDPVKPFIDIIVIFLKTNLPHRILKIHFRLLRPGHVRYQRNRGQHITVAEQVITDVLHRINHFIVLLVHLLSADGKIVHFPFVNFIHADRIINASRNHSGHDSQENIYDFHFQLEFQKTSLLTSRQKQQF